MSVRLIGPLNDLSARGDLFRRYCYAFIKAGIPFTISNVSEEQSKVSEDANINALSQLVTELDPDAKTVISFSSLEKAAPQDGVKNILYFYAHSPSILNELQLQILNSFDEIWSVNDFSGLLVQGSGVKSPLKLIGIPVDTEEALVKAKLNVEGVTDSTFVFYTIGRFAERSNFRALLEAYWSAFSIDDDVALVIKTHIDNFNQEELQYIQGFVEFCMQEGGYKKTPTVLILHDSYPRKIMLGLHKLGHCYVDSKRSDYLGINRVDAANFGNFIIQPSENFGFPSEMVYSYNVALRPVFSERKPYFYPKQWWYDADVQSLSAKMQAVFSIRGVKPAKTASYFANRQTQAEVVDFLKSNL